jgi:protein tyrosine phosphatase
MSDFEKDKSGQVNIANMQQVNDYDKFTLPVAMRPSSYLKRYVLKDKNTRGTSICYRLRLDSWPDKRGQTPEDAQMIVDNVNWAMDYINGKTGTYPNILSHCNGGMGRSPSLIMYHAIDAAAKKASQQGKECCCDFGRQDELEIDGRLNLAFVVRSLLFQGLCARGCFGYGKKQFKSFVDFATFRAQPPKTTQTK